MTLQLDALVYELGPLTPEATPVAIAERSASAAAAIPRLRYVPGSAALACHILLEWTGAGYETEPLAPAARPAIGAGPLLSGPADHVLETEEGTLTDGLAILVHIAEMRPIGMPILAPGLSRARLLETLSALIGDFSSAFATFFDPRRVARDESCHDAVRDAAETEIRRAYARWNQRLAGRPWIGGPDPEPADAYLYVMCRWARRIDIDIDGWPHLADFVARMEVDPGVRSALAAEGLGPIELEGA